MPVLAKFLRFWLIDGDLILRLEGFFFISYAGITTFFLTDNLFCYFYKIGLTDVFFLGVLFLNGGLNLFWYGFYGFGANTGFILMSRECGAIIFLVND